MVAVGKKAMALEIGGSGGRSHRVVSGWCVYSSPRMRLVSWKVRAFRVGTGHDAKGTDF